jgi:outer membrane receptor protein involved in Fe transport
MNKIILAFISFVLFSLSVFGQEGLKGKIVGTVIDKRTDMPLAGVNIEIKGTYMGAASDLEGRYIIENVNPGQYDIEATIIGYKIQLITGIEKISGKTKNIDFGLVESVLAFGQEIEVIGKKPLLEVDVTASQEIYSSSEINDKIVENVDDILGQQAGIVKSDNKIHIRGGRADEALYIVDGVSIKDPLSGYSNTVYINPDAIKELKVITGGFNAEYGQAMSGIIDVVTKDGRDTYSGSIKFKTDNFGMNLFNNYNTQILEFDFGGPELLTRNLLPLLGTKIPGEVTLFLSGYGNISDGYLDKASKLYPSRSSLDMFAPREGNDWHILGKLSWKIKAGQKISFSYDRSLNISQGFFRSSLKSSANYPYNFSKNLDNYPTSTSESILSSISWKHTLNDRTFYRIILGDFYNTTHSAVQNKNWSEYTEYLDLYPIRYQPTSNGDFIIRRGDGFYDYGDYWRWFDYFSDKWSIKADITSQISEKHQVKAGLDMAFTEMQVVDIVEPWVDSESGYGSSYDIYHVYSNSGSFYLQDQIKYDGMIINLGMRYDYWFPGKYVEDAINDPETVIITEEARRLFKKETFELFGMRGKGHLSPRMGISHPVTDQDVLYFNYGHFSQLPRLDYVYSKLKSKSSATYQLFGNPNLNPTTSVMYEIGLKHKFNENLVIELKAYYKDQFDYATSERITMENPRLGSYSFLMYFNQDYARSKGIELRLKQRYAKYLSGTINFTYAISKGKSSTPNDNLLVQAGRLPEKPLKENFLSWDKPIRLTTDLNFNVDENEGFNLFGWITPDKWGMSLHWELESGKRYTQLIDIEQEIYDSANPYAKMAPYWHQLDLRFYKYFDISADLSLSFLVEIQNAFDAQIPRLINPYTGREYRPGDILSESYTRDFNPYPNPIYNPSKYRWPRTVRFGFSLRF